jgi:putative Ca2+/H+ antiporter (TMEM165/GDT1 family)
MEIFYSFFLVAAAEMGDKTQILAFVLASRYKKPWVVLAGITLATILNHLLAALLGSSSAALLPPNILKIILSILFIGFAIWILIPDKESEESKINFGPFLTTFVVFFLAEIGDKTQLATIALAAKYQAVVAVTIGTTLGMLLTNGLAVFLGTKLTHKIPLKYVRIFAAVLFALFALLLWFI